MTGSNNCVCGRGVHECVGVHVRIELEVNVSLHCFLFLRHVSFLNWEFTISATMAGRQAWRSSCLPSLKHWDSRYEPPCLDFMWMLRIGFTFSCFKANILTLKAKASFLHWFAFRIFQLHLIIFLLLKTLESCIVSESNQSCGHFELIPS